MIATEPGAEGINLPFCSLVASYEDTLNNLHLRRPPEQETALAKGSDAVRDQYLLSYFLDVESLGSKSLLDLAEFRDPFAYKLAIATSSASCSTPRTLKA